MFYDVCVAIKYLVSCISLLFVYDLAHGSCGSGNPQDSDKGLSPLGNSDNIITSDIILKLKL